ncbi:PaeR7I family type II restriction endonuclease [Komagataeibacter swingsii]|uniref:Restriction endonuclease n=1 Tax=Komagataeibacter swingsii TaxID=215220 RepID=A0A2V4QUK9_9PROT|nr:PaeR7I family type II restriction endonuclease [Komagataeibacter swingsii]PYD68191.1 restriction endonuclease [Komagataeibacter swingsii]GBQ57535.1 type II restriction enzyme [Komagataeibacter swingsii DSM 16373]
MGLDLTDYEAKARNATMAFWGNRQKALEAKIEAGTVDTGERGAVTAGNTMDGFTALMIDLVQANGLAHAKIYRRRSVLTLPGFFRPTKLWDILVILDGRLIAAVEMKSHVGPSFGTDTARPFVGWLVMVEDADKSRRPSKRESSQHFPIFEEFRGASYLDRYDILCKKLALESLYTAACVLASPRSAVTTGEYEDMSDLTSLKSFVASFAAHIAAEAARSQ